MRAPRPGISVADTTVAAAARDEVQVPLARLPTGSWLSLPIVVVHGRWAGPTVALTAAIHGDELNGIPIIHQILAEIDPGQMAGTILAVPVVNVFGLVEGSRYLPDRRDLNRSFPGSPRGSLAARIAHVVMTEIIDRSDYLVDFHTGLIHRTNLPQIRGDLDDPITRRCAEAFAAPLMMHARVRDRSLREAATQSGTVTLLFEGGEGLRFDRSVIEVGVAGTRRLLTHLAMIDGDGSAPPSALSRHSQWVRASRSGIISLDVVTGQHVRRGQVLGQITDALPNRPHQIRSPIAGMVIGHTQNPLTHQGEAVVHVAEVEETSEPD